MSDPLEKPGDGKLSSLRDVRRPLPDSEQTLDRPPDTAGPDACTLQVPDRKAASGDDESPGASGSTAHDPWAAMVGQRFGDYLLLSTIAKGGMGVVYKARQCSLNRIVAVKMILAGQLADQTDVGRFHAEAEAAAALRHPRIVAIYDIGEVEGQHFFSMEYVHGKSLAEIARENPLPPDLAARYVRDIASAMQYAHDQGILHRDLKPSNILLDEDDQPRITDFGLAKKVEDQSQITMTGAVVGTPSYMPPEQATASNDAVGKHSDIYSTGAILYELLTGGPPFRAATPFETIRLVLNSEPVAPRVLNNAIPKDLETICLKAMQKSPQNRYETEQQLADELNRFLAGEPILARPIGRCGRLWRWCCRNPLVASLAAAALTLLMATFIAITVGYFTTSAALAESKKSFRQARAAVDELFTRVSENALLNQPGLQPVRHDLLRRALSYYQTFIEQRGDDASLQEELASTYYRVGLITEEIESPETALPWLRQALKLQHELTRHSRDVPHLLGNLSDTWNALGRVYNKLRRTSKAREAFGRAVDLRQQRVAEQKAVGTVRALANAQMNMGIFEQQQQDYASARTWMQRAQRLRLEYMTSFGRQAKLERDYAMGCYNLAVAELFDGHTSEGEGYLQEGIDRFTALIEADPDDLQNRYRLALCRRVLADSRTAAGDYGRAFELYERASHAMSELARRNPNVSEYQVAYAELQLNLGGLRREAGELEPALTLMREARRSFAVLVKDYPNLPRYRCNLAVTIREMAVLNAQLERYEEAANLLSSAETLIEKLMSQYGNDTEYTAESQIIQDTRQWIDQLSQK